MTISPGYTNAQIRDYVYQYCLLYTSDAADERSSVDLGGRRIIKKKKRIHIQHLMFTKTTTDTNELSLAQQSEQ